MARGRVKMPQSLSRLARRPPPIEVVRQKVAELARERLEITLHQTPAPSTRQVDLRYPYPPPPADYKIPPPPILEGGIIPYPPPALPPNIAACKLLNSSPHPPEGFQLVEMPLGDDLFDAPDYFSLGHCVAEDFLMGRGIAVEFRNRFGNVSRLRGMGKRTGEVATLQVEGRFVFYLVTKVHSRDKPTLHDCVAAIEQLAHQCQLRQVRHLAIPRLGCGLDELSWEVMRDKICEIFEHTDTLVRVYFKPQPAKRTFTLRAAEPPSKSPRYT